ncbi:hypothetical protein [Terrarubrum flagellatum]|uniref:hypothetical protein n=1 Tax=Terrirubrum flagellatum TaxID=2895980 RepID=UPI0031453FB3
MTAPLSSWLDALEADAARANAAEDAFRREIVTRAKELERERSFAFRRLNLMRAVADAIATIEDRKAVDAYAAATLRARLGWASESEARTEVLQRFAPVAQAMFDEMAPADEERPPRDLGAALREFEDWYAATHPVPFWALFENVMPETPLVDF